MAATILIVDDDPTTRVGLAELLQQSGYEATAVPSFEQAARLIRKTPPDLLIADVRLGPFNGLQLIISSPTPLPAIIITGFADPVLESDARRRGADYVLKPVDANALLELVESKLAAARPNFTATRRWDRKAVVGGLPARIDDEPARVVDVSYGGVRFEIAGEPERPLPSSFQMTFPSAQLSVQATLVWKNLIEGQTWLCGASLSSDSTASPEWFGLVDALS
jgi:DNA-binding response OmpR family regulator